MEVLGEVGESLGRFWKEFLQCIAWVPLTWPGGMRASDPPPTEGEQGVLDTHFKVLLNSAISSLLPISPTS